MFGFPESNSPIGCAINDLLFFYARAWLEDITPVEYALYRKTILQELPPDFLLKAQVISNQIINQRSYLLKITPSQRLWTERRWLSDFDDRYIHHPHPLTTITSTRIPSSGEPIRPTHLHLNPPTLPRISA